MAALRFLHESFMLFWCLGFFKQLRMWVMTFFEFRCFRLWYQGGAKIRNQWQEAGFLRAAVVAWRRYRFYGVAL